MTDCLCTERPTRAVILAGASHHAAALEWAAAIQANGGAVPLILIERRSLAVKLAIVRSRLRHHGALTVAGQLLYLAWTATDRLRLVPGVAQQPAVLVPALSPRPEVHVLSDINAAPAAARIRAAHATLAAVYGTSVIRGDTLAALPADSFNLHTGLTRYHRGIACTFWALAAGHPERIGVTVHRLTAGIDTGPPVAERVLGVDAVDHGTSMRRLDAAVARSGEELMREVLLRAATAELLPVQGPPSNPTHSLGPLHTAPTLGEYWRVTRRFKLR